MVGKRLKKLTRKNLARMIDHTQLKPDATFEQIEKLCNEAVEYGFFAVVINPSYVGYVRELVKDKGVKIASVVGFPLGAATTEVKVFETKDLIKKGVDEVDMVMNIGAFKSQEYEVVEKDIESVVEAANGRCVKVILETCYLTDKEKVIACKLAKIAGASFVKTSTGFGGAGATVSDVRLMRKTVGNDMGVKAAGGIRDYTTAVEMIKAGANRIGVSSSVSIIVGIKQ